MIACKLVHDTGTMIRFRTSQLSELPSASQDVQVVLPTGQSADCHFNRHPQNPNISGRGLVRYIKRRMAFGGREDALVERRTANLWVVHLVNEAIAIARVARVPKDRVRRGALHPEDIATLMALADRENDRGRRLETYRRVLRPAALRRMMVGIVGARCMVDGCEACETFERDWGAGSGEVIVEVHHIEQVANTIDHHPRNLCVLCANHHCFVHGGGSWAVGHDGPNVIIRRGTREMVLLRPAFLFPVS